LPRRRFKTCFISAPFETDTSVLRKALTEFLITWIDLTKLNQADNLIAGVDKAIAKSDFVCAILPEGGITNVLFELGLAYAREKPILAILGAGVSSPVDVHSLTYLRSDPADAAKIRSALKTFLDHADRTRVTKKTSGRKRSEPLASRDIPLATLPGRERETRTAQLFQDAGFLVSQSQSPGDEGADFAVWIDDLPEPFGNPLLVEVKAGGLSDSKMKEAAARLREQLTKTQGRCGVLVYWGQGNRQPSPVANRWPLVVQMSGATLETLIQSRNFTKELIRLRNMAVHGEV
jgi:hypothetical protein